MFRTTIPRISDDEHFKYFFGTRNSRTTYMVTKETIVHHKFSVPTCFELSPFSVQARRGTPVKTLKEPAASCAAGIFCAKIKGKAEPGERDILISLHRPVKRRMGKKSPTARRPVFRASPRCFCFFPAHHLCIAVPPGRLFVRRHPRDAPALERLPPLRRKPPHPV